ncbi:hypothetical protein LZ318_14505, partial [Saccharopolyspora indica]|uniref:hypothetical protein n=1 Tax=Saccharopolyspora indica TaxID=1229659 RepID=UPI002FE56C3E
MALKTKGYWILKFSNFKIGIFYAWVSFVEKIVFKGSSYAHFLRCVEAVQKHQECFNLLNIMATKTKAGRSKSLNGTGDSIVIKGARVHNLK